MKMSDIQETEVSLATKTNLPPCCLQILDRKFIFVGTYQLDKATGFRNGSIDIFNDQLDLLKQVKTYGAILDLKLSPFDKKLMLTAHSTGNLMLWRINDSDEDSIELISIANLQIFDCNDLIASAQFSPSDPSLVSCTGTNGTLTLVNIVTEQQVSTFSSEIVQDYYCALGSKEQTSLKVQEHEVPVFDRTNVVDTFNEQHSLECWTAEWGQLSPLENVIFSGGDDATIMAHDIRTQELIWKNGRIHDAGVVAIKCSNANFRSNKPTSILTGSYDDHIRTMDLRMLGDSIYPGSAPPLNVQKLNLGGGVWRFIEDPQVPAKDGIDRLLVCCMYDGAKIVEMSSEFDDYFQMTHFVKKGHESMCYGGDCTPEYHITCSFYDNSLQKWSI